MKCDLCGGTQREQAVSYSIYFEDRLHINEHVPAKVCSQCGERLYAPATVEKIQKAVWSHRKPDRTVSAPVIDYVSLS